MGMTHPLELALPIRARPGRGMETLNDSILVRYPWETSDDDDGNNGREESARPVRGREEICRALPIDAHLLFTPILDPDRELGRA